MFIWHQLEGSESRDVPLRLSSYKLKRVVLQGYELPGLQSIDAKRNEAFARVQRVTSSCYPSETALPLDHVLLRVEQMSSGVWPHRSGMPLEDHGGVADNVVKVCRTTITGHAELDLPC